MKRIQECFKLQSILRAFQKNKKSIETKKFLSYDQKLKMLMNVRLICLLHQNIILKRYENALFPITIIIFSNISIFN